MDTYSKHGHADAHANHLPMEKRGKDLLWALALLGGIVWVAVVVWFLAYSLGRAEVVAAQGDIQDPSLAQLIMAYALAVVFALPGVGLVFYGLARRRWAGGRGRNEVSG